MRFLVRATLSTSIVNQKMKEGTFPHVMEKLLGHLKPEQAYFTAEKGDRCMYLVVNLNDASEMPKVGETLFLAFEAKLDILPIMSAEDLMKAGPHIGEAVHMFG